MNSINDELFDLPVNETIDFLKEVYKNKIELSQREVNLLKEKEIYDYILLGIIGLLINNKARILLGKKQPFDLEIQQWCSEVTIDLSDLEKIADDYLEDNFSNDSEYIVRKVMLEYPKDKFLDT
tara:strand:+ start:7971 stop:8342 length:372 start_codon:yes stop_codon:yes gene_type:complete